MTYSPTRPAPHTTIADDTVGGASDDRGRRGATMLALALALVAVVALVIAGIALLDGDEPAGVTADVNEQGQSDSPAFRDAARLERRADGLYAAIDIPTPAPGSYDYPTADMIPPNGAPHPVVSAGASDAPEAFTGWMFVFNHPERCTDGQCDLDDIGPDTEALGGSYQFDGRVADGDRLVLVGPVRLGQDPAGGARMVEPLTAEVHLAIAPHGRHLPGADGWRQLNGGVGGPEFWWAATFAPD
ncbi:MAG: hypothetical protein HKN41_07795 [Ilumatobacter sp.]|nr:hypothetical protein [Ilumatobacter sp.]